MRDEHGPEAARASTEAVGVAVQWGGQRWYGLGALLVGDAFLAWASTRPPARAASASAFDGWRLRWGLAHAGMVGLGALLVVRLRGRRA